MGKASKRKKERREQEEITGTAENKSIIWQQPWFKYGGLTVIVIIVLVGMVILANHYSEQDSTATDLPETEEIIEDIIEEETVTEEEMAEETTETNNNTEEERDSELMDKPVVNLEMESGGIIKIELEPGIAPNTVNNFISLVEEGFYDGLIFHRVIPGFMIQGGCPLGTGTGDPGYKVKGEFSSNGHENNLKHNRGVISMARSGAPDSAGSQFFIMVDTATHLDGDYAAFGRVIEGMEEADRIVSVPSDSSDRPNEDQIIKKATVDTFGIKYEAPEKL